MSAHGKFFLTLFVAVLAAAAARAGYRLESVPRPAELRGGIVGIAFTPTGTLVVTTRYGERSEEHTSELQSH